MLKLEIQNTLQTLKQSNTILYPTDTVWGIGCDATNKAAVAKVFNIKKRSESKSLVILVDSLEMLQQYVDEIPRKALLILKEATKPITIIYSNPKRLANNVIANDNTVAIRIVQDEFCQKLIKKFGKPIVSTSANSSGKPTPTSFKEIELSILDAVDYVVNLRQNEMTNSPSAIVKIDDKGELRYIRK